jgi:hypothetical protein
MFYDLFAFLKNIFHVKILLFEATMSDQDPDPDPHWFGALNPDPDPYGNQVQIHNTDAEV